MRFMVQSYCIFLICTGSLLISAEQADSGDSVAAVVNTLESVEELRYQGAYEEGIEIARKALNDAARLERPELEVEAIYQLSLLYYYQQDYPKARAELQVGLARARVHELEGLEADFLAAVGVLEWKQGNLHIALPKLQEAMRIREKKGNFLSMASISNNIGIIYYTLKNYADAEFHYREALKLLEENDSERLRSSLYINLSESLIPMDRLEEAEKYLQAALELEQEFKDPQSLAYIHFTLGELASRRDQSEAAVEKFREALKLQENIGDKWAIALTQLRMSREFLANGMTSLAMEHAQTGYNLAQELNGLALLRDYSAHFVDLYEELEVPGHIQFFTEQHEWLNQRVSLENEPEEPAEDQQNLQLSAPVKEDKVIPAESVIITLLAAMILILIFENTRLRLRTNKQ